MPASEVVIRTRALPRLDETRATVIAGRTLSPSSKTVGAVVGFGSAAGPVSTGGGGGGTASSAVTVIEPAHALAAWILQKNS